MLDRPQARPQKWIKWEKSELDPTFPGEGDIANAITERDLLILIGLARRDLPPTMINAAPNARGALGLPSRAPGRRLDAAVRSRRLGRSSAASTKPRQVSRRAGEGDGQPKAAEPFNIPAELGILALRLGTSTMMFHNGLDKVRVVPPPCLLLARWCGCGPSGEKEILTTLVPLSPPPFPFSPAQGSRGILNLCCGKVGVLAPTSEHAEPPHRSRQTSTPPLSTTPLSSAHVRYLDFLPEPLLWTYAAIAVELTCPVLLALGVLSRPSAAALLGTMCFAITFHLNQTGLEGFPLAVVENHQYAFETSSLYAGIFFYFLLAGPGKISLRK